MSTKPQIGLVHESEAQRQYARIKIPVSLRMKFSEQEIVRYQLLDISAGGFSFKSRGLSLDLNGLFQGQLYFEIDGFKFILDTEFIVVYKDEVNRRVGVQFANMDAKQIASLRYLITSYLSGELISTSDMLTTLSRENFTKQRNHSSHAKPGVFAKSKALVFSGAVFAIGLVAAGFIALQLYDQLFITRSSSGQIASQSYQVTAPRDAEFTAMVSVGDTVGKGQPIATFRAPMVEYLSNNIPSDIDNQKLTEIAEQWIPGTLSSPCDCVIAENYINDKQYLAKGANAFHLVDSSQPPYVLSYFDFKDAGNISIGDRVAVEVLGEHRQLPGTVESIKVIDTINGVSNSLRVQVLLAEELSPNYLNYPIQVRKSNVVFDSTSALKDYVVSSL